MAVYFLGGIAYNRIVHHARGLKQIPNYQIWVEGFDFIKVNISEELRNVILGRAFVHSNVAASTVWSDLLTTILFFCSPAP